MNQPLEQPESSAQDAAVRRVVGIAALRRLRKMVNEDQAIEADKISKARLVLVWILIAAALGLAFVLHHPIFA